MNAEESGGKCRLSKPAPVPQEPLPEPRKKSVHSMIELSLTKPAADELVSEIKHLFEPQYHAAVVTEILNVALDKSAKDIATIAKSLLYAVWAKAISPDNFIAGITEIFEFAPDLYIDIPIPMIYSYIGKFIAPQIEKNHITFLQVFKISQTIISQKHGHLLLRAIIKEMSDRMGSTLAKSKWQESGLKIKQWLSEDEVESWLQFNIFFEGSVTESAPFETQIQKEAEQQQRHIEMMNAVPMGGGGFRRDEGGRGKRGDRRQNNNAFQMDTNMWKSNARYTVDTSKLMNAAPQKNLNSIKLAWNHRATKSQTQATSNSMISMRNMYSVLENVQTNLTSLRDSGSGSRSGSTGVPRSNSGSRSTSAAPPSPPAVSEAPAAPPAVVLQEPLPEHKKKTVHSMILLSLINPDEDELVSEIKHCFEPQYHAAVVIEIINVALQKSPKDIATIAKSLLYAVSAKAISPDNFIAGITEIFEFAPDLCIDIPKLYDYLGKFIAPQIEKEHITFLQVYKISQTIINEKHGHLLLRAIIKEMRDSMGPTFAKIKWQESGLKIKQWMSEDEVASWLQDNKLEFLKGNAAETTLF